MDDGFSASVMELNGGFQISFPSLESLDILLSLCPLVADWTRWPPAASWSQNFNGSFAAAHLKHSSSGLCPYLPDDFFIGNGSLLIIKLAVTRI